MINYILYNPIAGYGKFAPKTCTQYLSGEVHPIDIRNIHNYRIFLEGLQPEDRIILCGGDGTLIRFINDTDGISYPNKVFYQPTGSGNDFARDLGKDRECEPFDITSYLQNLPIVTVKGKQYRFLNGVGYGIDGYCCEVGDKQRATSTKPINYTTIAIKGLLFHYRPTNAIVTVDGVRHTYKKVWIAPTMNGRFYGGGMMPTPHQDRLNPKKTLSVMIFHGSSSLRTLCVFPSLFKGEHIKHTDIVEVLNGNEITVEFDRPTALQVDGETIRNVTSYTACHEKVLTHSKKKLCIVG